MEDPMNDPVKPCKHCHAGTSATTTLSGAFHAVCPPYVGGHQLRCQRAGATGTQDKQGTVCALTIA
jgi:hypothetical protein